MRVIADTSPLIALDRIGQLSLLPELFGGIVRPQSVLDELRAGHTKYEFSEDLESAEWIVTEPDPEDAILRQELGAGETAVIALALHTSADLVILDDLRARLVAESLGLKITGTLGVLLAAHRKGALRDLRQTVGQLIESGFRLSPEVLEFLDD